MMKILKKLILTLNCLRLFPHLVLYNCHANKRVMRYDVERWLTILGKDTGVRWGFLELMRSFPEYRNLFYHRIGPYARCLNWMCPRMETLHIATHNIGPGLFIQHGFATIISAGSIGKDCWINQQVTIGYASKTGQPIIGDCVVINAGAKVIGGIRMGNNSTAGANAVVVKDVPDNCTVVGVPAYIVRRNGIRVKDPL